MVRFYAQVLADARGKQPSEGGEEEDEEDEEESLLRTEPPEWARDDAATNCTRCKSEFSLLWRRVPYPLLCVFAHLLALTSLQLALAQHHCRYCGGIFCDKCSQYSSLLPFSPDPTPQRVCDEVRLLSCRRHHVEDDNTHAECLPSTPVLRCPGAHPLPLQVSDRPSWIECMCM
jgi:hypothetical protein